MGSIIKSIEYVYPSNKINNDDLSKLFPDYDFGKFEDKVGIQNRYWVTANESAFELAKQACEKLFLKVERQSIDFILSILKGIK